MSSESNGRKPDSQEPGRPSGFTTRSSARAPSAWGAVRDALASLHNLDALLRSTNVLYRTIRDLLPELRTSAGAVREIFERAQASGDEVIVAVGDQGASRIQDLEKLLDATAMAEDERDDLAKRARHLADELEAAADLLALIERSAEPVTTDVSLHLVVRETARLVGGNKGREVAAHMDTTEPDANVHADPLVLGGVCSRCSWGTWRRRAARMSSSVRACARAAGASSPSSRRRLKTPRSSERRSACFPRCARRSGRRAGWPSRSAPRSRSSPGEPRSGYPRRVDRPLGPSDLGATMTLEETHRQRVEEAFAHRKLLADPDHRYAVEGTMAALDRGELRVATPPENEDGEWTTHAWIKEAVLLYFAIRKVERIDLGPFEFHDKIPLKKNIDAEVRIVPPGVARFSAFLEPGAVLMPGYVNVGARVGSGTMVDTWATVGSCAQIGRDCHLAGGVGIGGVLEPPSAQPVIVEDGCFVGSRAVIVEGVRIGREAVIGAGVVLTSSTAILDVSGPQVVEHRGRIPPRSVVIPGVRPKKFPAGEFAVPCALIIGQRTESTDRKVSLNAALRDFAVPV